MALHSYNTNPLASTFRFGVKKLARINSRAKGAAGEREFCAWLEKNFNLPEKPQRELGQARDSGADVVCYPFAFEVKRREKLDLLDWWAQVKRAVLNKNCSSFGLEPVVAFRQNKAKWEFLIAGEHIGIQGSWVRLTEVAFKKWVKSYLEAMHGQSSWGGLQQQSARSALPRIESSDRPREISGIVLHHSSGGDRDPEV